MAIKRRRLTDTTLGDAAEDAEARIALLNDPRSNAAGILRYLDRRDAGTLTPLG